MCIITWYRMVDCISGLRFGVDEKPQNQCRAGLATHLPQFKKSDFDEFVDTQDEVSKMFF